MCNFAAHGYMNSGNSAFALGADDIHGFHGFDYAEFIINIYFLSDLYFDGIDNAW